MQNRMEDLQHLQEQNQLLQQENKQMQLRLSYMEYRTQLLQQKVRLAEHWTAQTQIKYNNLAQSKLGRLTLKLWDFRSRLHAAKLRGGKWYLLRLLFDPNFHLGSRETPKMLDMGPEQQNWLDRYFDRLVMIPDSNGCRYYEKSDKRIGLVCDEFFYESVCSAADFVMVTPDNWEEEIAKGLDAMLFVTAWRGLHEEWRGLGTVQDMEKNPVRRLALKMLNTCKCKQIPTIFYSKEDPPNYDVFLDYAKACDYVCTTAQECIPKYQEDCGHDRVQAVCFGINPVNHNPIGFRSPDKEKTILFSGSWMMKYPDRCRELATIFDGILDSDYDLHIIDRNYPGNPKYSFPEKYFSHSSPALPHDLLQKVHKLFDWAVNINSVKGSNTMFANRAFELQANGVLLLSNLSVGVNRLLPTVQMVVEREEVARILDGMTDEQRYERQIAGIRSVMTGHSCFDRLQQILAPLGLDCLQPERCVLVLADAVTDSVRESFDRQSYPCKKLMMTSEVSAADIAGCDMVTWFGENDRYDTFYLEDMVNGFKYTACDYITKDCWLENGILHEGTEHQYVSYMPSKYRTLFWTAAFEADAFLKMPESAELENGYSIDHFNYEGKAKTCSAENRAYQLSVVIPVRDSGLHLYAKSFAGLRRSSMFENMEILLMNEQTADSRTLQVEADILSACPNVRVLSCEDGLRQGLAFAAAPYVAFLMPENEPVGDGLARMYSHAVESRADLVTGNLIFADSNAENFVIPEQKPEELVRLLHQNPDALQAIVCRTELAADLLRGTIDSAAKISAVDTSVTICYH